MFRLNQALDRAALKTAYARDRRVRITDLLAEEGAATLHAALRGRQDWRQIVNSGGKVFDLDRATRASMSDEQRDALDQAVFAGARDGFQHRYEAIRVPDGEAEREDSSDILASFASWLSGGEARDMLRDVTGEDRIAFASAPAGPTTKPPCAPSAITTRHSLRGDVASGGRCPLPPRQLF